MRSLTLTSLAVSLLFAPGCVGTNFGSPGFYCNDAMGQTCPPGQSCQGDQCVTTAATSSGTVTPPTKTANYSGTMMDPGLNVESDCPDKALEPNDTFKTAVDTASLGIAPDNGAHGLQNLAICPKGKNPAANDGHDIDLYSISVPSSVSAVVNLTYNVEDGDLDVGIYSASGTLIQGDGSAVSNACVSSSLQAGTYYIGVFGANNVDSNRYTMSIAYYSSASMGCSTNASLTTQDMAF